MRLFVGLEPPSRIRDHLAAHLRDRSGTWASDRRVRWSLPAQWHLTLTFLGAFDRERVDGLSRRLRRAADRHAPPTLAVEGVGAFGSRGRARVVWAGIGGDTRELHALAGSVAAACRRSGVAVEDRRFRPHLTLARLREPADVTDLLDRLAGYAGPAWTAREVQLVRSHLGQAEGGRSRYEVLEAFPLRRG